MGVIDHKGNTAYTYSYMYRVFVKQLIGGREGSDLKERVVISDHMHNFVPLAGVGDCRVDPMPLFKQDWYLKSFHFNNAFPPTREMGWGKCGNNHRREMPIRWLDFNRLCVEGFWCSIWGIYARSITQTGRRIKVQVPSINLLGGVSAPW